MAREPKYPKYHCSQHGAIGQGTKNGHCELCWPPKPIYQISEVVDILEVEIEKHRKNGSMGSAEQLQKIKDYIK